MRILFLLNGYNLRKYPRSLPRELVEYCECAGHEARSIATQSLDHFVECMGRAADRGVDLVFSGGGDGSLYHAINHPAARQLAITPLPLGTINAFLRSVRVDVKDPVRALRQLLQGKIREVRMGMANGHRFACFASFGFDARVIHKNPPALKRAIRAASFGVTGVKELWGAAKNAIPGKLTVDGDILDTPITSCIVSNIQNYAGVSAFRVGVEQPHLHAIATTNDNVWTMLKLIGHIGYGRLEIDRKLRHPLVALPNVTQIEWKGRKGTYVQLDGEATELPSTNHLTIEVDPLSQRVLLPPWIK